MSGERLVLGFAIPFFFVLTVVSVHMGEPWMAAFCAFLMGIAFEKFLAQLKEE